MWEMMTERIEELGGEVRLETPVTKIEMDGERVVAVHAGGERIEPAYTISSLPLRATVGIAEPAPPKAVVEAAQGLRYRDFLTVSLVLDGKDLFPDNWIYIHEDGVEVGRIQNFRSWSPWMVPDPDAACVGMEYFCFKGDHLWTWPTRTSSPWPPRSSRSSGSPAPSRCAAAMSCACPLAYPMYDETYAERVETIRGWLDPLQGFQQVGRNGLHRYNNSDHSMLSAMRAVDNALHATGHDIWAVNVESVYHETQTDADSENPYVKVPSTVYEREPLVPR
jgi:protoporphyrinogen oxidase